MKIIECVPNFSEGRKRESIDEIARSISSVRGVMLLDFSMDFDHNRSVFTFIGSPEAVLIGAKSACEKALELIDLRNHEGVHPRLGACDVVPFIPLCGAKMEDAVDIARRFGREFGEKYGIPVYYYGEAAIIDERKEISSIRKGGYEGLRHKLQNTQWTPDAGTAIFNDRWGATITGARAPLIAFNINLNTNDLNIANNIARSIRQSSGGLKSVMAMGVHLKSRGIIQVSMNLTNYRETSIITVFEAVKEKASLYNCEILESELIGLIPEEAIKGISPDYIRLKGFSHNSVIEFHLKVFKKLKH